MRRKKNPAKKKAVSHGEQFEEELKKKLGLGRNISHSPDFAKQGMLIEAKYSEGNRIIIYTDQLKRVSRAGKIQKDIYGEPLKAYYAIGFRNRVYIVPVEKLKEEANKMEEKKTMWGMPPKGMKRIKWIDAAEKDSFDRGEKEKRKIIERYGRPYVRFSEEQVKGMAVEEFELDKRIIREKKKKKIQTGFW